jgi:hypothetical protein
MRLYRTLLMPVKSQNSGVGDYIHISQSKETLSHE